LAEINAVLFLTRKGNFFESTWRTKWPYLANGKTVISDKIVMVLLRLGFWETSKTIAPD